MIFTQDLWLLTKVAETANGPNINSFSPIQRFSALNINPIECKIHLSHQGAQSRRDLVRQAEYHFWRLAHNLEKCLAGEDGDAGVVLRLAAVEVSLAGQHGKLTHALSLWNDDEEYDLQTWRFWKSKWVIIPDKLYIEPALVWLLAPISVTWPEIRIECKPGQRRCVNPLSWSHHPWTKIESQSWKKKTV